MANEAEGASSGPTDSAEAGAGADPRRFKALAVIGVAQLMIVLDVSIVNLAIPRAEQELNIAPADIQWVVTAYTLAFGGLLLLGGRIADYTGRKRTFIVGLVGFAAASLLGGLAPSPELLFAARGLQGVFAALLAPAALALISVTFTVGEERAKAFAVFGAITGGGAALGVLLGGVLTEYLSWRWCLMVNTPIALAAVMPALRYIRESRAESRGGYDIPGAVTVTLGLTALVYGFTSAAPEGSSEEPNWTTPQTYLSFLAAVVLLSSFIAIEARTDNPLLPLRILRNRNRAGAYVSMVFTGAGLFAMFLFLGLFMQLILGYSPVRAGLAFLPFSLGIIVGSAIVSRLLPRVGPRPLMLPGLIGAAVGMLWLTRITPESTYWPDLGPALVIISFGMACTFVPVSVVALHGVQGDDSGIASAVINTSQQVGGSLGTALMNTVAVSAATAFLALNEGASENEALTHGYTQAFLVGAGLLLVAAAVVAATIRLGRDAVQVEDSPTPTVV